MLSAQSAIPWRQLESYYLDKVQARKIEIQKTVHLIAKLVQDVLKDVEIQEPRFISTLNEVNGRYEGLQVHSPYEYEVILYLNQMGVFNFVDDGSIQGCAVLKLSDGRKRSMSLWVEFITASGYLSARKIRSRFQGLVLQAIEKPHFRDKCKLLTDSSDVRLHLYDKYVVKITCAFRCNSIWPRSASQWPNPGINWPTPEVVKEVRCEGFDLLSKESAGGGNSSSQQGNQQQQQQQPLQQIQGGLNKQQQLVGGVQQQSQGGGNTMEGDAWAMSMTQAENLLLGHTNRRKTLSILKTLRDRHLDYMDSPISNYIIKTLVLYECEKHMNEQEWHDYCLSDRVIGILLQLVSCLQCRKCPHYFLPQLDLLKGNDSRTLDQGARMAWALVRQLMLSVNALETL